MRVDNSAGKGTSGMDKFSSVIDRMSMKLGSKFFNSLITQFAPLQTTKERTRRQINCQHQIPLIKNVYYSTEQC